jgi:flagellar biosynthesis/type III secretory pathway chaperone
MSAAPSPSAPPGAPVTTTAEAEQLSASFLAVMDALLGVVQQETELVRAGKLAQAAEFAEPKGDLTRRYIADTQRLRASRPHLARVLPAARLETLRRRHDALRAQLQINLTVLATAHAVTEGIVRGVSSEMARRSSPQTYGASGRTNAPRGNTGAPLAVSRML